MRTHEPPMPFSDHFLIVNVTVVTAEKNNTDPEACGSCGSDFWRVTESPECSQYSILRKLRVALGKNKRVSIIVAKMSWHELEVHAGIPIRRPEMKYPVWKGKLEPHLQWTVVLVVITPSIVPRRAAAAASQLQRRWGFELPWVANNVVLIFWC